MNTNNQQFTQIYDEDLRVFRIEITLDPRNVNGNEETDVQGIIRKARHDFSLLRLLLKGKENQHQDYAQNITKS